MSNSRFSFLRALSLSLVTGLTLAAASAPALASHGGQQTVLKPSAKGYRKASVRKPPRSKIKGQVTTWDLRRQQATGTLRGDPYKIEATGLSNGDSLRVEVQEPSADLELPAACDKQGLTGRQIARLMQRTVSKALRFTELTTETANTPGPASTFAVEKPATLATHTPVRMRSTDRFGRKSNHNVSNVQGVPATTQWDGREHLRLSSDLIAPYQAWANLNNVLVTQAYETYDADGGKAASPRVKLVGLAAFPIGAKVTIVNERMENLKQKGHTLVIAKTTSSGTARAELPAFQDDRLRIEVEFEAVAGQSQASKSVHHVRVPSGHGKPSVERGDVRYFRAVQD